MIGARFVTVLVSCTSYTTLVQCVKCTINRVNITHTHTHMIKIQEDSGYDKVPLEMVSAGLHCDRSMSRHILPLEFMLGW